MPNRHLLTFSPALSSVLDGDAVCRGGVEYFEVYHGPINTTYGQVWWTGTANPIPQEVVKRFDGKVMAIVGIEMDQVRRSASVVYNVISSHATACPAPGFGR